MSTVTTVTTDRPARLYPIAHSDKFDVRLSETGNLVLYREDTGNLAIEIPLTQEQLAEIQSAS